MNKQGIIKEISNKMEIDIDTLTVETRFKEDLGADSLDLVEMVMEIEDEFEITIDNNDAANIKTIGDFINVVEGK